MLVWCTIQGYNWNIMIFFQWIIDYSHNIICPNIAHTHIYNTQSSRVETTPMTASNIVYVTTYFNRLIVLIDIQRLWNRDEVHAWGNSFPNLIVAYSRWWCTVYFSSNAFVLCELEYYKLSWNEMEYGIGSNTIEWNGRMMWWMMWKNKHISAHVKNALGIDCLFSLYCISAV